MDSSNLNKRMNRVIGQLNAVNRMIEEDAECDDILIQINASKKALHKIGQIIIEENLEKKTKEKIDEKGADELVGSFKKSLDLFLRL